MKLIKHFINGAHYQGQEKNTVEVFNPATGEVAHALH
jgi:acyl-CoA reductase-like NAD-dependent aldehyde dehydrogenase